MPTCLIGSLQSACLEKQVPVPRESSHPSTSTSTSTSTNLPLSLQLPASSHHLWPLPPHPPPHFWEFGETHRSTPDILTTFAPHLLSIFLSIAFLCPLRLQRIGKHIRLDSCDCLVGRSQRRNPVLCLFPSPARPRLVLVVSVSWAVRRHTWTQKRTSPIFQHRFS